LVLQRLKPGVSGAPFSTTGNASTSTVCDLYVEMTPEMRVAPAVTFSALADFGVLGPTGTSITPTAFTAPTVSPIAVLLRFTVASGLTQGDNVRVRTAATGAWVAFDAEL